MIKIVYKIRKVTIPVLLKHFDMLKIPLIIHESQDSGGQVVNH